MKARAIATLSVLALTAALAPLTALPATAPAMSYVLNTRQYDPTTAGEYDGVLRLSISTDGIVSGSFMNTEGLISQVTGGMKGQKIWFLIGNGSRIQNHYFNGTLIDSKLLATAPGNGLHTWTLEGKPANH
jgi:hypothetical protein